MIDSSKVMSGVISKERMSREAEQKAERRVKFETFIIFPSEERIYRHLEEEKGDAFEFVVC